MTETKTVAASNALPIRNPVKTPRERWPQSAISAGRETQGRLRIAG